MTSSRSQHTAEQPHTPTQADAPRTPNIHHNPNHHNHRFNLALVPALVTLIQTALFGFLVFWFFCLFGGLSVSDSTVAQWTGAPADKSWREKFRIPFEPTLIKVSFVLSGVGALNFAAAAASDNNHREHFVAPLSAEVADGLELRKRYAATPITTPSE